MIENSGIEEKKEKHGLQQAVVLLMFLAGILNSNRYLNFMGLGRLNQSILFLFYSMLVLVSAILVLNLLTKKKVYKDYTYPYWVILLTAVTSKILILFLQSPSAFFPGGVYFSYLMTIGVNLIFIIVVIKSIRSFHYIRKATWAFGLGASLSAIIPLLMFPEMIGSRTIVIDGYVFSGAFWNSVVISYMSVGWLLVALSIKESSRFKRGILLGIFLLLIFGSLAGLSRATLLSLFLSILAYLIISKTFIKYLKVIILTILIISVTFFFFQDAINNFADRLDGGINIENENRVRIWMDYMGNIPNYFLLGEIEGNYKKYSTTGVGPHSVFLNWFSQFGIVALFGFIALLFGLLKSINIIRHTEPNQVSAALFAWLISYLSIATINETGFSELSIFGAIGIILAWGNIMKRKFKAESKEI